MNWGCKMYIFQHSQLILQHFFDQTTEEKKDLTRLSSEYVATLGDDNPIVKLLKASCSQGIVSPAWIYINLFLLKEFPYKDVKLGWTVYIIFSRNRITVIHRKKEQGHNEETLTDEFSFVWELKMVFDSQMENLKSAVYAITDLSVSDEMDPIRSTKLKTILRPWREPTYLPPGANEFILRTRSKSLGNTNKKEIKAMGLF